MNSGDTTMTKIQTKNGTSNNQNSITSTASGGEQLQEQISKSDLDAMRFMFSTISEQLNTQQQRILAASCMDDQAPFFMDKIQKLNACIH